MTFQQSNSKVSLLPDELDFGANGFFNKRPNCTKDLSQGGILRSAS
jgi:hypothetical protein